MACDRPETTPELGEYGIVANAMVDEPVFRLGAKVWLCGGNNGDGFESRTFRGLPRKGPARPIKKWARTIRFHNFRAAWIPEALRSCIYCYRGTRAEVEAWAKELDALTQERRAAKESQVQPSEGPEHEQR